VIQWLYRSVQRPSRPEQRAGPIREGGDRRREGSADRAPSKRPRSPSADPSDKSTSTESTTATETISSGNDHRKAPSRRVLQALLRTVNRMCSYGDGCSSLRGEKQCPHLHSADIKALEELSPWARETAITFMGAHPSVDARSEADYAKMAKASTAWRLGLRQLVERWVDKPELVATEAPAVPAPHPDAAPSGVPRAAERSDLVELKGLLQHVCLRGDKCTFAPRCCPALHPLSFTVWQSPFVRDEVTRLLGTHPYRHLQGLDYKDGRIEAVERAWRAGLVRQVDKLIEWHDSGERSAQGTGGGPGAAEPRDD
jgi:hypothetical protein